MGIIINHKKHYLTRLPIGIAIILTIAFSPIIIAMTGAWLTEVNTGQPCHEGNCFWMTLVWFGIVTVPGGFIILSLYTLIVIIDTVRLLRKRPKPNKTKH